MANIPTKDARDAKVAQLSNKKNVFFKKARSCPLSGKDAPVITYKDPEILKRFCSEKGKILPRRITSVSSNKQRKLAEEIKIAREIALLPFSA